MSDYIRRLERLNAQNSALAGGVTLGSIITVAFDYDQPIMSQAWNAYSPALPTSVTGAVFAVLGWILCYVVLLVLSAIVGSRNPIHA